MEGSNGDADTENRLMDTEEEGESGTNGGSSVETCTLPYVKWIASGNLLYGSGSSNWCSVGWGRWAKREGTYVFLLMFMLMYGRNQHNIVKQLSFN